MAAENHQHVKDCTRSCTLLVPGLLELPSENSGVYCDNKSQPKALELFLAKAKQQEASPTNFKEILFGLFDTTSSTDQPYPLAPVCYFADADSDSKLTGWCLRADPVQLTPNRDDLVLAGSETLSLTMDEAEQLVAELNVLLEQDGWRLEAKTATRWYLHLPDDPQITTSDLSQVRGQSIKHFLPGGPEGKQWHRIMNEVQMVLHTSKVNAERQASGLSPVSSLWFWGGGVLPEFDRSRWSQVWSDEVLSRGLAKVTRTPLSSMPENGKAWLSQADIAGEHLIVCDGLFQKQEKQQNDADIWCRALQEFESEWLTPLLEALRNGELDQLSLNACDGRTFSLTKSRLKHWWRWRKPIGSYCR